jgi:hypothetical protein
MAAMVRVEGSIYVQYYKEGDVFIAYSPMLDLSSCGGTFEEASHNFNEAVDILFSECEERGTLEEVLLSFGWQTRREGEDQIFIPPMLIGQKEIAIPPMPVAA